MNEEKKNCGAGGCKDHIKGVHCDVHNCVYHDGECYCNAGTISVGPSFATCSQDTVCATFKQKTT